MDPNANLAEQLRIAKRILFDDEDASPDAERLAELVLALDEWISNRGFMPRVWENAQR